MRFRLLPPVLLAAVVVGGVGAPEALAVFGGVHDTTATVALDRLGRRSIAEPSAALRRALPGARVTANRFGLAGSVIADDGALAADVPGADGAAKARAFVADHPALFGLDRAAAADLVVLHDRPLGSEGRAVLLRQRFGSLDAGAGLGQVAVALHGDDVVYASSTLAPEGGGAVAPATLTAQDAYLKAARALGVKADAGDLSGLRRHGDFGTFRVAGLDQPGYTRLVALPVAGGAPRAAYETIVADTDRAEPLAATTYVDARSGELLLRSDNVDHATDNPQWDTFPATPPLDGQSAADSRQRWCWKPAAGCTRVVGPSGSPERTGEWDTLQTTPEGPATTSGTTTGNSARSEDASESTPLTPGATLNPAPIDLLNRVYGGATNAPFTNAWKRAGCDPTGFVDPTFPDVTAAKVNLFVLHNRMHDWAYRLGFTEATYNLQLSNLGRANAAGDSAEGDPELGGVQAGATGGTVEQEVPGRDNANQITLDDGIPPITNMYLWQPLAGAFYGTCTDGDFDESIVGHEYTHAISNRMVGGPSAGLDTTEGGSMGESYSDLDAMEYLLSYGFVPVSGENPYSVGALVTGDQRAGIRDYPLDDNPLNYSDLGFDLTGVEVHADGEVWNGINFAVRDAYLKRYDAQFPSSDRALEIACADGDKPVDECPGNRRYIQDVFDAFLLMPSDVTMVGARDAYLGADKARTGGADQDLLWDAFARGGLGRDAKADPNNIDSNFTGTDVSPTPSFVSPLAADNAEVTFAPSAPKAQLFVGDYEARATPVADTDPGTPLGSTLGLRPGTYHFVARADGFGAVSFTATIPATGPSTLTVPMAANVASSHAGAVATGDAIQPGTSVDPTAEPGDPAALLKNLIDDTEATDWASSVDTGTIAGQQVTVALAGGKQTVDRVNVSALLRAADSNDAGGDTVAQNRFTALRQFALEACTSSAANNACTTAQSFSRFYTSPTDAFPSSRPRPRAPDLRLRGFDVPDTAMTHLRMVVLSNQCTGGPDFQGDQDSDPTLDSDCVGGSTRGTEVRAAELQAFSAPQSAATVTPVTPVATGTSTTGAGAGTPGPGTTTVPGSTPASCSVVAGFRTVAATAGTGRALRLAFEKSAPAATADVDVFAQSRGRTIVGERLVARFAKRTRSLVWNGKANRPGRTVRDGYYVARFSTPEADGKGVDVRRVALRRVGGRFSTRPSYALRSRCTTIRAFKLERPVFGGPAAKSLGVSYAVAAGTRVTVQVVRGTKVVATLSRRTVASAATQRLRVTAKGQARGDVRVRLTTTRAGKAETATLTARRL